MDDPTDGGASYTATSGTTSVLVSRYTVDGAPLTSFSFGPATAGDSATLAGIAPHTTPPSTATVAFAGSFSGTASFSGIPGAPVVGEPARRDVHLRRQDRRADEHAPVAQVLRRHHGQRPGLQPDRGRLHGGSDGRASIPVAGRYQGTLAFGGLKALVNKSNVTNLYAAKLNP